MPSLAVPAVPPGSLAALEQPDIEANGLVLRPWRASDRSAVVTAYSDPAIRRWHCRSMDDDEARDWIAAWARRWRAETGAGWAVVETRGGEPPPTAGAEEVAAGEVAAGEVVGQISLRTIELPEGLASISYWVLPGARGRRVAGRALTALTEWSFGTLGFHRIEVSHSTLNLASCRVAQSAGFAAEGTKRAEARHADGWHDMHLHARLESDSPVRPMKTVRPHRNDEAA